MVAFQTENFFFLEITTKLAENGGFPYKRPSLSFFEIAPTVKSLPLQKFRLPPKKFRSGYVPERHGLIFLNDVIFAMKSQAV